MDSITRQKQIKKAEDVKKFEDFDTLKENNPTDLEYYKALMLWGLMSFEEYNAKRMDYIAKRFVEGRSR